MALNSEDAVFHKINMAIISKSVYIHTGLRDIIPGLAEIFNLISNLCAAFIKF